MQKKSRLIVITLFFLLICSFSTLANTSNNSITNATVFIKNIAPTINNATVTTDAQNRYEPGNPINFTVNVTDDNGVPDDIQSVTAKLDMGSPGSPGDDKNLTYYYAGSGPYANLYENLSDSTLIPVGSPFGTYTVNITATDDFGLSDNFAVSFNVTDLTAPVINWINATPNPVSPIGVINITANVSDNINISYVWVQVNGTNYTMTQDGGNELTGATFYLDTFNTYLPAGVYDYTVYANDTLNNLATSQTDNFTISTLVSLSLNQIPISFGNATPGETMRRAENGTNVSGSYVGTTAGFPVIVNNTGNVDHNFSIAGADLTGLTQGSYSIGVGNMTWNTTANLSSPAGTSLTTSAAVFATNIVMATTENLYFWIDIPTGLPSQNYRGTINISVVQS